MNFFKRTFIWLFCMVLGLAGLLILFAPYVHEFTLTGKASAVISGFGVIVKLWQEGFPGPMSAVLQLLVIIMAAGILTIGVVGMLMEFLFRPIPEIKKGGVILAVCYTVLNIILMIFLIVLCVSTDGQAYFFTLGVGVFIAIVIGLIITILLFVLIRVLGDTSVWSKKARAVSQTTAYGTGELPAAFGQAPAPMALSHGQMPQSVSYGQMPQSVSYGQVPQSVSYGNTPPPISYVVPLSQPTAQYALLPEPAVAPVASVPAQTPAPVKTPAEPVKAHAPVKTPEPVLQTSPTEKKKGKTSKEHVVDSTVTFRFIEGMSEKQIRAAVEDLFIRANRGEADAQFRLGICYQNGTGVPQSNLTAAEWQQKASAQGHAQAKYVLGEYYVEGKGVPRKIVEGITLIKESARKGFVGAQMRLGNFYQNGEYLPRDYEKAVYWYTQAAEQGNAFSVQALKSFERGADGKWALKQQ